MEKPSISENDITFQKTIENAKTLRFVLAGLFACLIIVIIMKGLSNLVSVGTPEKISALAQLADKLGLGTITGWIFGACATGAWWLERTGKKRSVKLLGEARKKIERYDAGGRSSSNLTETGDTPED